MIEMNALVLHSRLPATAEQAIPHARPAPANAAGSAYLNHLRFVAMSCRSKARTSLFEACALLQVNRSASLDAHAEALMRCLSEALGKAPRLLSPGTAEVSFDEQWLLQLATTSASGDDASFRFLIGSRVKAEHRRLVGYLVGQIADHFRQV